MVAVVARASMVGFLLRRARRGGAAWEAADGALWAVGPAGVGPGGGGEHGRAAQG
jgi:hypothetical protein